MKNYIKGILLGFICGLVASMLWVIVYVYVGFISALCAIPIAKGIEFGFKRTNANVDKKTPYIVATLTILIVLTVCFLLIPIFMLFKYGYNVNLYNLNILYQDGEFMSALIKDSLISVLFAFLGMWSVIKQLKLEANPEVYQEQLRLQNEYNETIKDIFIKNKSFTKETGIPQDEINVMMKEHPELLRTWMTLNQRGLIKKAKKSFYYYPSLKDSKPKTKKIE